MIYIQMIFQTRIMNVFFIWLKKLWYNHTSPHYVYVNLYINILCTCSTIEDKLASVSFKFINGHSPKVSLFLSCAWLFGVKWFIAHPT